jgi:hypothetical protein
MRNMDTLTKTPAGVNRDIVDSVMDLAGYKTRTFAPVIVTTAVNVLLTGVLVMVLTSWLLGTVFWVAGALIVAWLLAESNSWYSHSLHMRNALERRFGLAEYKRHRSDYSAFWEGW